MLSAVELAAEGRVSAPPNPWVGCVIVSPDGRVVGRGFHEAPGLPHAEVVALREAGAQAQGATAYVTLEPCAHVGRTPPCAPALVAAGIARVKVGVTDPDPRARGGIAVLEEAGIPVEVGVEAESVAASLAPYLHQRRTGRAYCLLKAAVSIDGRTAAADGTSQWITGPAARADTHRLRAESQAVMVGSGTALADHPTLTPRSTTIGGSAGVRSMPLRAGSMPLRVVADGRGRVPAEGPLFDVDRAPTLVVTTAAAPADATAAWAEAGAEVAVVGAGDHGGGIDLSATLELLGARGVLQVMVEGGGALHGAFLRAGLADRLAVYVGGAVLGEGGRPLAAGLSIATIAEAIRWRLLGATILDGDIRLDYVPQGD